MAGDVSDDLACVARVLAGDEAAAEALVARLQPVVTKIVRARLPNRSEEEDMTQAVYLKLFAKLEQFSGRAPIEHWASRIAVNTCLNQMKRERARPELRRADLSAEQDEVLDLLQKTDDELAAPKRLAARELVELLLARLNPRDRLLLEMLHLEGKSLAEVHAETGWSVAAIKLRTFRARQKMRKTLKYLLRENPK